MCMTSSRRNFNPRSPHGERPVAGRQGAHFPLYFNPRSPHGERLQCGIVAVTAATFQSTLPARGATLSDVRNYKRGQFQSTLPARGATFCAVVVSDIRDNFNPRSPHGERRLHRRQAHGIRRFQSTLPARGATTNINTITNIMSDFNPRSPHGERQFTTLEAAVRARFQSTLPARGATSVRASGVGTS